MPKAPNFKRFRINASKFASQSGDYNGSQEGTSGEVERKNVVGSQQTISKFFSFNSNKSDSSSRKRSSACKDDLSSKQENLGSSESKVSKLYSSPKRGRRNKERISPNTVKRLKGYSLENSDGSSLLSTCDENSNIPQKTPDLREGRDKPIAPMDTEIQEIEDVEKCEASNCSSTSASKNFDVGKHGENGISKSCLGATVSDKKLTPLEKQVVELKKKYPDVVLLIECGYKYRFFGEDAEIASKELKIVCYLDHNFYTACIPTHRLFVHVQRLVAQGYKVGVVKQTETAALKAAGDNKNTLFERKLQALYTKATLIGEEFNSLSSMSSNDTQSTCIGSGYLTCIYESSAATKQKVDTVFGIVAVQPSSGDTFYTTIKDTSTRSELESCLTRLNSVELLLPHLLLHEKTESLIQNLCCQSSLSGSKIRLERMHDEAFEYTSALNIVMEFYGSPKTIDSQSAHSDNVQNITNLTPEVVCSLSALITYLKDFKLDSILKNMNTLSPSVGSINCMSLNAVTLRNLEVFQNLGNYSEHGSLLWTLNYTSTKSGKKMLRQWISSPFKDIKQIEERLDIVTEMLHSNSSVFSVIEKTISKLPDLERGLCSALYQRCSCWEFFLLVQTLKNVRKEFHAISERASSEIQTAKLKDMISEILHLLEGIYQFSENLHEQSARENNKTTLFVEVSKYTSVVKCQQRIKDVEKNLVDLRPGISKLLRLPAFSYSTVSGQKYLIEVRNSSLSIVPSDWIKISATKQVSRFRSPEVEALHNQLKQLSEQLLVNCDEAWKALLAEFGSHFYNYRKAVLLLAEFDCYFSLCKFSKQQGFCRPIIVDTDNQVLNIIEGRNPVVEKLMGEQCQYVANDTKLNTEKCCMIITGPNMGGKSSYVRQVALITILAQIGCYVPAESATVSVFDGIYMRMGASDDLYLKRSTFMTEMQETSDILAHATSKSLVVLDELGRGTSTHDGMAIAYSTLDCLLKEVSCITLFVTHYPPIAELQRLYPNRVSNNHMSFIVSQQDDKSSEIGTLTFLYTVSEGIAEKSYGVNVADLAGIPMEVLIRAKKKSEELEKCIQQRRFLYEVVNCILMPTTAFTEKIHDLQTLCTSNVL